LFHAWNAESQNDRLALTAIKAYGSLLAHLHTLTKPQGRTMSSPTLQALQMQNMRPGTGAQIDHLVGAREQLDPFIMADHFRMWQPTFGPHPHAGFSAVTYLFEDSETGFRNRDSRGHQNQIDPGDLHWTLAGAGVMHEEIPLVPGQVAHGLQIFVNLPTSAKGLPPAGLHVSSARMPRFGLGDANVKLVFGHWADASTTHAAAVPMPAPGDATLLDVWLPAGGQTTLQLGATQQALLLRIEGELLLNEPTDVSAVAWAVGLGTTLQVRASSKAPARMALLAGTPWREPLVMHGPFGMSTQAELQAAIARYQAGDMGHLAPQAL
jgi:redox-sensitive bicupin YhaK (pirin superfamily)